MSLPEHIFRNPVWHGLQTRHRRFAVSAGAACRYPADVAPFAAVAEPTEAAMQDLHSLLGPEDPVWLIGEGYPEIPELQVEERIECLQMVLRDDVTPPDAGDEVTKMSDADAADMVALTTLAFPGFFRIRTCEMGSYYGARCNGTLIAMGGERMMPEGYPEISGVCTHPAHRGKGLASRIIWQLVRNHRRDGLVSWLHVTATNYHAIELYRRMGFEAVREVMVSRFSRKIR